MPDMNLHNFLMKEPFSTLIMSSKKRQKSETQPASKPPCFSKKPMLGSSPELEKVLADFQTIKLGTIIGTKFSRRKFIQLAKTA